MTFVYPLTAELYPTSIRTMGLGLASVAGRVGTVIMPMIAIKIFYVNYSLPFLLYFVMGVLGSLSVLKLPPDTLGKNLDSDDELYEELSGLNNL